MNDADYLALIQAELDGALDGSQRAELARQLLADPEVRAAREDFQRVRALLESVEQVEPPAELRPAILHALPPARSASRFAWPAQRWRYAALIAGIVGAGTLVYQTVAPGTGSNETFGTIAARRSSPALDAVVLDSGPVTGRISLYRDGDGLVLSLDLATSAPVDVQVASQGEVVRKDALGQGPGQKATIALPGSWSGSRRSVDVTFLMAGHEAGRATLTAPGDK